ARAVNDEAGHRLLLHADADGALVVLEDVLQVSLLLAAAAVNAVEALGVFAGIIIELQLAVAPYLKLVRDLAGLNALLNRLLGFQVLVRQFEIVIPERAFSRAQLLELLPVVDAAVV